MFGSFLKPGRIGGTHPRASERFRVQGLSCALGEIVDLSATGMRLRHKGRPPVRAGDVHAFTVESESQAVRAQGRVAWVRRRGVGTFEIGVQFQGIKPGVSRALVQLAKYGFIQARDGERRGPPGDAGSSSAATPPPGSTPPTGVRAAIEVEDLYAILGVAPHATGAEVRAAYHRLAKELHPDTGASPEQAERLVLVNKAFSILRDPVKRTRYDALRIGAAVSSVRAA